MNKSTIITILLVVVAILAISLFNSYRHDKDHHDQPRIIERAQDELEEAGDRIEHQTDKMKDDMDEMGNKIERKTTEVREDLED